MARSLPRPLATTANAAMVKTLCCPWRAHHQRRHVGASRHATMTDRRRRRHPAWAARHQTDRQARNPSADARATRRHIARSAHEPAITASRVDVDGLAVAQPSMFFRVELARLAECGCAVHRGVDGRVRGEQVGAHIAVDIGGKRLTKRS
eukprot:3337105-Prymnesium_polylepis.1